MRYALVLSGSSIDRFSTSVDPAVQTKAGYKWVSCPPVAPPSFDPASEIITGPIYTFATNLITEAWGKRTLTAQELSDAKDAKVSAVDTMQLAVSFNMENRVRVLEGKAAVTQAQYKAALKALL